MSKLFRKLTPFFAADGAGGGTDGAAAVRNEEEQSFETIIESSPAYKAALEEKIAAAAQAAVEQAKAEQTAAQAAAEKKKELEKLPEEERQSALLQAETERADRLEAEKNTILLRQMATTLLAEKGLATSMTDMVVGNDEQVTKQNIDALETAFAAAVAAAVKEKIPGYTPKAGEQNKSSDIDAEISAQLFSR